MSNTWDAYWYSNVDEIEAITDKNVIAKMSTEEIFKALDERILFIGAINSDRPDYEVIALYSVRRDGRNIEYISNPSEEVKIAAIKENGFVINLIDNPSEKLQLLSVTEAIDRYGVLEKRLSNIMRIKNPTSSVIEYVWERTQAPYIFKLLKKPTEQDRLKALTYDLEVVKYIKDLSVEEQLFIVNCIINKSGTLNVKGILVDMQLCPEAQLLLIDYDTWYIRYIQNPTKDVIKKALSDKSSDAAKNIKFIQKKSFNK